MRITDTVPLGAWFVSNLGVVPNEDGILVMLPDGRCVQFPSSKTPPRMYQTHRLWYSCPDANTIRFRMTPGGADWIRYIERTDEGWTMICYDDRGRSEFPCKRAAAEDLPDWFSEMMDKNLTKMEEMTVTK